MLRQPQDPRDAALATELFYGYLRFGGRLDALLNHFLSHPDRLPPMVRRILGLAAFELTRLSRVPAHASLSWAVDAVGAVAGQGLARLANAVLRNVQRLGPDASTQDFFRSLAKDEDDFLSRWYAAPPWLVALWRPLGLPACEALLEAQLREPPLGVRVNMTRPDALALAAELASRPDCLLAQGPTVALSGSIDPHLAVQGRISRQSAAAQLALRGLEPSAWPTPVWDACAGRGGKTLALAEAGVGPLWASDTSRRRLRQMAAESARLGLAAPPVFLARAESPPLAKAPGTILLDAPCSGLGVLSRRPDSKWKRRPQELAVFAALQASMLEHCAALLPAGGVLAYITCTVNPAENEAQVERLCANHPLRDEIVLHPDPTSPLGEFFFAARLRKAG